MNCQNCGNDRILSLSGKTSDMFYGEYKNHEIDSYVPSDIGIGGGDYIEFNYCLECGQIQGTWPLDEPDLSDDWVILGDW